jgi:SAM-dependent methyltransferase
LGKTGAHVIGLDVDRRAVAHAAKQYSVSGVEFKTYNGKHLPFADNTLDVVLAMHVIEHVGDAPGFVGEVNRVLKSGGKFVCVTPDKFLRLLGDMAPWNVHHKCEYGCFELEGLLKASFKDVKMWGVSGTSKVMAIEKKRIEQGINIARLDRFNLRRKLPTALMSWAAKIYHAVKNINKKRFVIPTGRGEDLYKITEYSTEETLDLIGVCEKP